MDTILNLQDINWSESFIAVVAIVLAFQFLYKTFIEGIIQKFGIETKGMRQRREERELLKTTAEGLNTLRQKHDNDESDLKKCLTDFITETRDTIKKQDVSNRQHWETSKQIRRELTDTIKTLADDNQRKGEQIDSLIIANKELLAEKINEKYKYYISIKGIPEDEYDEFVSMHKAYNGVGGNHHGDAKFQYCIDHLQIIPVETKLIYENK